MKKDPLHRVLARMFPVEFVQRYSSIDNRYIAVQEFDNYGEVSLARNFACDDLWRARHRHAPGKETAWNH